MIDPTGAVSSATSHAAIADRTSHPTSRAAKGATSFGGELTKFMASSDSTTKAPTTKAAARPDGEQTKKIAGHPYSRIENGSDKGMFINQLASSPRQGSIFRLVERDDRVFHVYGTGKTKLVVEVKSPSKTDATPTPSTGGSTPGATSTTGA